jgi:hypothetical protein
VASPAHLVRRFIGHLRSRPLTPPERAWVMALINEHEAEVFWQQSTADVRHALETAQKIAASYPDERVAQRAALWHDIGKIDSRLGVFSRSLATAARVLRLPRPPRWRAYDEHGPRGAVRLEALGCEPLVVAFARLHPEPAPPEHDGATWRSLLAADDDWR